MTRHLSPILALLALVAAAVAAPLVAQAQQDEMQQHRFVPTPEDRAAFLDARIAALHAGLELTPDQEKLWPPLDSALHDFGKLVADQRQKFHDTKQSLDPIAKLKMRSDNMIARGQGLAKIADAASPLYAVLSDAQKHRLPILTRAIFHPFHHHGMMAEGPGGMMGEDMMGRMRAHMMDGDQPDGGRAPTTTTDAAGSAFKGSARSADHPSLANGLGEGVFW